MSKNVFLSTGTKDVYPYHLEPLQNYLSQVGVTVYNVVLHGKRCLRLVVPEECDVAHLIQKIRGNITQIIERMPSNTAWNQVKASHTNLRTFSEIEDVTQETMQYMTECHAIV